MASSGRTSTPASDRGRLSEVWRRFALHECRGYSPLYEAISLAVASRPAVLDLVLAAPPSGMQPNVLLAAAHDLVLSGIDHPLRELYERASTGEVVPAAEAAAAFCDLVLAARDDVLALLKSRRTNTNECGRSAVLLPALRWAASQVGEPIALLDAGASAGLNLHLDRYLVEYDDGRTTGPATSPVRIACAVRGGAPIDAAAPAITARVGLDRSPVDLEDDDEVRWLLACVWPDTGRLDRTRAAIALARRHRVVVERGDVIDDLAAVAERLAPSAPLVVITSWVLAYLSQHDRERFLDELASISSRRTVAWISAEAPGVAPRVPGGALPVDPAATVTSSVLGGVLLRSGHVEVATALGRCHPHGATLLWAPDGAG